MKKLIAILRMKCPKCYQGDMYKVSNPFNVKKLHAMPPHCEKCGQLFDPEPGFYIGAMYVSYGLCAGLFLMCFFGLYIMLEMDPVLLLVIYSLALLVLFPFIFRYSRTIYLHLFYDYDPQAISEYEKKQSSELDRS